LIRSVPIAGMALTVPDGTITSSKLAPTIVMDNGTDGLRTTTETTTYEKLQQVSITLDHTSALLVSWQSHVSNSDDFEIRGGDFIIYLDGVPAEGSVLRTSYEAGNRVQPINIVGVIHNVSPGVHTVEVWWKARYGGTLTSWSRQLSVIAFGQ
jgi:hypothetical protein